MSDVKYCLPQEPFKCLQYDGSNAQDICRAFWIKLKDGHPWAHEYEQEPMKVGQWLVEDQFGDLWYYDDEDGKPGGYDMYEEVTDGQKS